MPVRVGDGGGQLHAVPPIGVLPDPALAVHLLGHPQEGVIFVGLGAVRGGLGEDAVVLVQGNFAEQPVFVLIPVGAGGVVVGEGHLAPVGDILAGDPVLAVILVGEVDVPVEVLHGEEVVLSVVGIDEGVAIGVGELGEVVLLVVERHTSPGAVGDGGEVVMLVVIEVEGAHAVGDRSGITPLGSGELQHLAVRLGDPDRAALEAELGDGAILQGGDIPAAPFGQDGAILRLDQFTAVIDGIGDTGLSGCVQF